MPVKLHAATGAGRDVDDATPAALLHARYDGAHADEGARQVRVDDVVELLVGDFLNGASYLATHATGAVHQNVGTTDARHERVDGFRVGDVDGVLVDTVHRRAVLGQSFGDCSTDALSRTRNDGHFAC